MQNKSGIIPFKHKVVVLVDENELAKRAKTSKLIIDSKVTGNSTTEMLGTVIAVGEDCFEDWQAKPKIGDKIMFDRYAGKIFLGADESIYRMMPYNCICGICVEGENVIKPYELKGV